MPLVTYLSFCRDILLTCLSIHLCFFSGNTPPSPHPNVMLVRLFSLSSPLPKPAPPQWWISRWPIKVPPLNQIKLAIRMIRSHGSGMVPRWAQDWEFSLRLCCQNYQGDRLTIDMLELLNCEDVIQILGGCLLGLVGRMSLQNKVNTQREEGLRCRKRQTSSKLY